MYDIHLYTVLNNTAQGYIKPTKSLPLYSHNRTESNYVDKHQFICIPLFKITHIYMHYYCIQMLKIELVLFYICPTKQINCIYVYIFIAMLRFDRQAVHDELKCLVIA